MQISLPIIYASLPLQKYDFFPCWIGECPGRHTLLSPIGSVYGKECPSIHG